jgi:hypothetical protein
MNNCISKELQIFVTDEYHIFKKLKGNRGTDLVNVKRIEDSMKIKVQYFTVIVNENMEVIDGQHRIEASKELGLQIFYKIEAGTGLKDAVRYNTASKNWNKPEHLESQVDLGNANYIMLQEFMKVYPEFKLGTAESILTNSYGGANKNKAYKDADGKLVGKKLAFQEGLLVIEDKKAGYERAAMITEFKPYFKKYNNGIFAKACIAVFQVKGYDHTKMLRKIAQQQTKLVQCSQVKQYRELMEEIYNFGIKTKNKISLRF